MMLCRGLGGRVAILFLLGSAGLRGAALDREYSHRVWRVPDGLPQNRIQAISQTPDGYLWIGTSGGLVRFDGVRFVTFDRSNTPAMRDDSILALCPSKDGSLWIGTEGGRLLRYRQNQFSTLGPAEGLTNGFVRALHEDAEGTLWIGTDRGFFRLRAGKVERLDGTGPVPVTSIISLAADSSGVVWAAGTGGLLRATREGVAPSGIDGVPFVRRRRAGGVWLLGPGGVRWLEGEKVSRVPGLEHVAAVSATEDADGNLWVGTLADGLLRSGAGGVLLYRDSNVLPSNTVLSVFEDRESNLWIGTTDGLLRLSRSAVEVLGSRDGLIDDNVSTVYEGRDGGLWLVTITGRIFRYAGGKIAPYTPPSTVAGKRYRVVYEDRRGTLWLGSGNDGIARIEHGQARTLSTADGLRSNMVRQFLEDRQGNLWIALGSGVSRWDGQSFRNYYLEDGLSYGSVRILKEDRRGDLLVGTDSGLNRVRDGRFISDPAFAALEGERVWTLHEDAGGALWVGTRGGGLFRIRDGKASRLTVREGLLSNAIYQVIDDGRGNLWMSGPAGVFFAPQSELDRVADGRPGPVAAAPYGMAEGLESTQMNGGIGPSGFRATSGDLWFPSVKGAVRIGPNHLRLTQPSPVLIESVTADDRPLAASGELVVPAGHGKLEIHYTAASLRSPERITFRYKLEGFDPDWNLVSRTRVAFYTNLPPGRYTFRVAATDSTSPRESSEASLPLVWKPRFHQTAWFYGLCAAAAALCVWASLRLYARQTRLRYAVQFAERTRLAREMHDTVIQGCAGVSTLLEAAASLPPSAGGRLQQLVDQARVQARLTLDEARQAVWDLRHAPVEGDVVDTLRDFARHLSAEKGIPIEVNVAGAPGALAERTMRGLLLVAREAIRNAANHADPRRIEIRVKIESGEALLEVVDDGRGFTPAAEQQWNGHYGIVGMRERVEQLGGRFLLHSEPGRGTSVIARLPVGRVAAPSAS